MHDDFCEPDDATNVDDSRSDGSCHDFFAVDSTLSSTLSPIDPWDIDDRSRDLCSGGAGEISQEKRKRSASVAEEPFPERATGGTKRVAELGPILPHKRTKVSRF